MRSNAWRAVAILSIVAGAAFALRWFGAKIGPAGGPSRTDVLKALAHDVIIPQYGAVASSAAALTDAITSFCTAPNAEARQLVQRTWSTTRQAWKATEAHNFGPAKTQRFDSAIDFWPLRPWMIDAELAKTTPIDDAYIATVGSAARGLPAIEYMIYGPRSDELITLGAGSRSCQYLTAIARHVHSSATALHAAWQDGFAAEFATAGAGSQAYPSVMDAVNALINQFVGLSRTIEDAKLARPLGKRYGNMPQLDAMESPISGHAVADMLANLRGMRSLYAGSSLGIKDLVPADRRDLNDHVLKSIANLEAQLQAVTPDLATVAEKAMPSGDAAFKSAVALTHLLNADLISALGVTPTFSDNDGD